MRFTKFLIGLLQTTVAPEDQEQWFERWEDGFNASELQKVFESVAVAFELFNETGPAFLQDFDLPDGEQKPLHALLIDGPGSKTLKDNLDHFIKGGMIDSACEACSAAALFTLQTNAPSGGAGHRVGLRGGGPLTTLVLPGDDKASLWKKLWLNVLTEEDYSSECQGKAEIFPWMAETRFSDKTGQATLPDDTHLLQMYWGMPRRIRAAA